MAQKLLYLHAGTHKTGTTSIQYVLFERRKELSTLGYTVVRDHPTSSGPATNCKAIAHSFIRSELQTPTRFGRRTLATFGSQQLRSCLNEQLSGSNKAIMSAEAFCYMRAKQECQSLTEYFAALEVSVVPVIFFRQESEWRRSWEAQLDKSSIGRDARLKQILLDDWYFARKDIEAFWRDVSPSTIVLDYNQAVASDGSVVPSFLAAVGLPRTLDSGSAWLNRIARSDT